MNSRDKKMYKCVEKTLEVKLAIIDPLGTIIKGESFSMNVVNDENCMRRERLILYIGECIYRIDNKGFIIERLIPHE